MNNFVAFDVETATSKRSSICEIGIAVVRDGEIKEKRSWLVQPPNNEYFDFNTFIHGIGPEDTKDQPLFPEVWKEVCNYVDGQIVVCHNSAFDMGALRDALNLYDVEYPTFQVVCTIRPSRKTLPGLSRYTLDSVYEGLFGKPMMNHHKACDDAAACGEILVECLKRNNITSTAEFEDVFDLKIGKISPDLYRNQHAAKDYSKKVKTSAKNIVCDSSLNDPDNYFYGKVVCFTGAFSFSVRKDLFQYIANIGGTPADNVTGKTDILVVGQQDFRVVGESGMSSKQRKAYDLLSKGQEIEIISESDFLSYASEFDEKS